MRRTVSRIKEIDAALKKDYEGKGLSYVARLVEEDEGYLQMRAHKLKLKRPNPKSGRKNALKELERTANRLTDKVDDLESQVKSLKLKLKAERKSNTERGEIVCRLTHKNIKLQQQLGGLR